MTFGPSDRPGDRSISRRAVLVGGAGMALLTACGTSKPNNGQVLVALFDTSGTLVAGSPQRVVFGIGDNNGVIIANGPTSLTVTVTTPEGRKLAPTIVARHQAGLPRAYYPLVFTPPTSGAYTLEAKISRQRLSLSFGVGSRAGVKLPGAGDAMPVVDSPTVADHRGVDPICTRAPTCPLHSVNLRDALDQHRPTALLVATPAYCQTAICGPVLDIVLAQRSEYPEITFIHAEVYASGAAVARDGADAPLAPVLQALHLTFEPCLFLVDSHGRVAQRVDTIFDQLELRQVLRDFQG